MSSLIKLTKDRVATKKCLDGVRKYQSYLLDSLGTAIKDMTIIRQMVIYLEQELKLIDEAIKNKIKKLKA